MTILIQSLIQSRNECITKTQNILSGQAGTEYNLTGKDAYIKWSHYKGASDLIVNDGKSSRRERDGSNTSDELSHLFTTFHLAVTREGPQ